MQFYQSVKIEMSTQHNHVFQQLPQCSSPSFSQINQKLIPSLTALTAGASAFAGKSQPCSLWQPYAISPYGEIFCHVNSNAATIEACRELYDGGALHRILGSQRLYPEIVAIELCCPRIAPWATRIE